jgi:carbamoyltransferase
MNLKIKFRESFRPFAPIVLRHRAHEYFEMGPDVESPYMLLVAPVRGDRRTSPGGRPATGLDRILEVRSVVPAVTHVDNSARIQTVDAVRDPRLFALLEAFEGLTGCPVMVNTSFNVRGEPIVCTPADAYHCFMATDIDALVIDDFLLLKEQQPAGARPDLKSYLDRFGND